MRPILGLIGGSVIQAVILLAPVHQLSAAALDEAMSLIDAPVTTVRTTPGKPPDKSQNIPSSKLVNFDSPERVPNEYVVIYKDNAELAQPVSALEANQYRAAPEISPNTPERISSLTLEFAKQYKFDSGGRLSRIFKSNGGLRGFVVQGVTEGDLKDIARDPRIKFIEPVLRTRAQSTMYIQTTGTPSCSGNICAPWDLDRIDQVAGIDGNYHYVSTGAGVTIWVLDSGIDFTHQEFRGQANPVLVGPADPLNFIETCTVDSNGNVVSGCEFGNYSIGNDPWGHGTAVTSVAAGTTYGVAKNATLVGVVVLDGEGPG